MEHPLATGRIITARSVSTWTTTDGANGALEAAGASTVTVDYPVSAERDDRWWNQFRVSVEEQVRAAVAGAERVTFVAKSLGTAALAGLGSDMVGGALADAVWLTPLFGEAEVRAGAVRHGWRSLLVAGGAGG